MVSNQNTVRHRTKNDVFGYRRQSCVTGERQTYVTEDPKQQVEVKS